MNRVEIEWEPNTKQWRAICLVKIYNEITKAYDWVNCSHYHKSLNELCKHYPHAKIINKYENN